eukprot:COSAG06_NODE_20123_length_807_cov_1.234463_1_plen_143_part_01
MTREDSVVATADSAAPVLESSTEPAPVAVAGETATVLPSAVPEVVDTAHQAGSFNAAQQTNGLDADPGGSTAYPPAWRDRVENLCGRFPAAGQNTVVAALRFHDGHAGKAAKYLQSPQTTSISFNPAQQTGFNAAQQTGPDAA